MKLGLILKRTKKERQKAIYEALTELDAIDCENIGLIDGREFALKIKRLAHLLPQRGKYFDIPEVIVLLQEMIKALEKCTNKEE